MEINGILNGSESFRYQMLDRLRSDCDYLSIYRELSELYAELMYTKVVGRLGERNLYIGELFGDSLRRGAIIGVVVL